MMSENESQAFVDYYELLGVDTDASVRTIRTHYLKLAKDVHPDAGGSTEAMQKLNKAYKTLANATTRAAYDLMHSINTGHSKQHFHYLDAPETGNNTGDDEYIDMFLDQVYREFAVPKKRKSARDKLSGFFGG